MDHYFGCIKFEFNDVSLSRKKDSEKITSVNVSCIRFHYNITFTKSNLQRRTPKWNLQVTGDTTAETVVREPTVDDKELSVIFVCTEATAIRVSVYVQSQNNRHRFLLAFQSSLRRVFRTIFCGCITPSYQPQHFRLNITHSIYPKSDTYLIFSYLQNYSLENKFYNQKEICVNLTLNFKKVLTIQNFKENLSFIVKFQ
ncbi:hypothetical protein AGLY_000803 [Aphis glycines]|uniref:Uncharacterized protein n=1 Tax=Aphis glycines TaxID=307491 RepID=A0A6G0U922_APHGL|nr:hypothetical protein AGLY_000803 [Aphis glycines]